MTKNKNKIDEIRQHEDRYIHIPKKLFYTIISPLYVFSPLIYMGWMLLQVTLIILVIILIFPITPIAMLTGELDDFKDYWKLKMLKEVSFKFWDKL